MSDETKHPLKVFLCHASGDKPPVRDLYKQLTAEGVDAWLDQERLLPGQDWRREIPRAVHEADVVVVCLSNKSITKEGYVQKEIKFALDIAEEKPEGTIFLIPARLEDCPVPERLSRWHWVDLYEEKGFGKLLRSLKLRANAVGATIESASYQDLDKELEQRIKQLYTEGLAAYYTEDWDKACHRFQSILSEQPNHRNAAEKLVEAEQQRTLSKLYEDAREALRCEEWQSGIAILEKLSQISASYRDVSQLLANARRQRQLKELYNEAETLYAGQKWEAVVRVFEQIAVIEPNYPDSKGLLASSQKEAEEVRRIAGLNDLYGDAVAAIDGGNWQEARRLLENVHKSQTGFLETEKLLRKVEKEIIKEEEKRQQNEQINTLYEQAHGLLRSQKWRKALDKLDDIRKLDEQFSDTEGITEKAQKELEREEREAQKQDQLAAMYAEAVRLLKEEEYQDALDQWQGVKAIDPQYPDRQWVQRTARKKLSEIAKPVQIKPRIELKRPLWTGLVGLVVVGAVIAGVIWVLQPPATESESPDTTLNPIAVPSVEIGLTSTPTSTPTTALISTLSVLPVYDNFDNAPFDGGFNSTLWEKTCDDGEILQEDGNLVFHVDKTGKSMHYVCLIAKHYSNYQIARPLSFEAKMSLDTVDDGGIVMQIESVDGILRYGCGMMGQPYPHIRCFQSEREGVFEDVFYREYDRLSWHTFRFTMDPTDNEVNYYMDGKLIASFFSSYPDKFSNALYDFHVQGWVNESGESTGFVDYVYIGTTETGYSDLTMYDDFDNQNFDNTYNTQLWSLNAFDFEKSTWVVNISKDSGYGHMINQSNGQLMIGVNNGKGLFSLDTNELKINQPMFSEARLYLDPATTKTGTDMAFKVWSGPGETVCGIRSVSINPSKQGVYCYSNYLNKGLDLNVGKASIEPGWHTFRFEVYPEPFEIASFVDGLMVGKFLPLVSMPENYNEIKSSTFYSTIQFSNDESAKTPAGYFDYVRMGAIEDDPDILFHDSFNNSTYNDSYNRSKWEACGWDSGSTLVQNNGFLAITHSKIGSGYQATTLCPYIFKSRAIDVPMYFEARLMVPSDYSGSIGFAIEETPMWQNLHTRCEIEHSLQSSGTPQTLFRCVYITSKSTWNSRAKDLKPNTWYTIRIEVYPAINTFYSYLDGQRFDMANPGVDFSQIKWLFSMYVSNNQALKAAGYLDDIRIGILKQ